MINVMRGIWKIELGLLPFTLELFTATAVYVVLLGRKKNFLPRMIVVCLLLSQSPLCMAAFAPRAEPGTALFLYVLFCMTAFAEMIFGIWFCFEVRWEEALYCATCAYVTEHVAYCLRILLNELTDSKLFDSGNLWYFLLHAIIYLLAYQVVAKRLVQDRHYEAGVLYSAGLTLPVLFIVYIMSLFSSFRGLGWLHAVYALVCCLFILLSQCAQANRMRMQKELQQREQIWQQNKAHYEMAKETIEIVNRKCHDLKHQIQALKGIENVQKQRKVVESIEESVMIYETMKNTGNSILDTVLAEKGLLCKENAICLNVMADGKLLDFMDEIDLYTLFGNALDNAIEANLQVEPSGERYVNLQIREKANLVLIRMENPYHGEIRRLGEQLATTKPDKEVHGFGVKSIRHTVEKYGGQMKIETGNQIFVLRLMFPLA